MRQADETACTAPPMAMEPVIDATRCEAKGACVKVCPYDVFELRTLTPEERAQLSPIHKLKAWVHGNQRAVAVRADACQACGRCVKACPERAIALRPAVAACTPGGDQMS